MVHRRRLVQVLGLAIVVGVTACGSDDEAGTGVVGSTVASVSSDTTTSAPDADAPGDGGVLGDVDDVCQLVEPAMIESVVGTPMTVVTATPSGCLISNGETGSAAVSISLELTASDNAGTEAEACKLAARPFVGVEPTTIGGYEAFSGIDLGSSGFTAQACAPEADVVVSGDSLTREQALAIAELALTEG